MTVWVLWEDTGEYSSWYRSVLGVYSRPAYAMAACGFGRIRWRQAEDPSCIEGDTWTGTWGWETTFGIAPFDLDTTQAKGVG